MPRQLCNVVTGIIHPLSTFKRSWERLVSLLVYLTTIVSRLANRNACQVLFSSIVIPWQMAFRVQQGCRHVTEDTDNACIDHDERVRICCVLAIEGDVTCVFSG